MTESTPDMPEVPPAAAATPAPEPAVAPAPAPAAAAQLPPAGWYPDPSGYPGYGRYWNGTAWEGPAVKATGSGAPLDVLGIVALGLTGGAFLFSFIFALLSFPLWLAAIVVAIVGIVQAKKERRPIVLSLVALLVNLTGVALVVLGMLFVFMMFLFAGAAAGF